MNYWKEKDFSNIILQLYLYQVILCKLGNPALQGVVPVKAETLNLEFINQADTITIILLSSPIKKVRKIGPGVSEFCPDIQTKLSTSYM